MSNLRNITIVTPGSTAISHVTINRARKFIRVAYKSTPEWEYEYPATAEMVHDVLGTIEDHESLGRWVDQNLKKSELDRRKIPASIKFAATA